MGKGRPWALADEEEVFHREVELTFALGAEENRKISGCLQGWSHPLSRITVCLNGLRLFPPETRARRQIHRVIGGTKGRVVAETNRE